MEGRRGKPRLYTFLLPKNSKRQGIAKQPRNVFPELRVRPSAAKAALVLRDLRRG